MPYTRPWKSFAEQLAILQSRNMQIESISKAESYLSAVGYYRLSAYWYPFRQHELKHNAGTSKIEYTKLDTFEDNTQFVDAVRLYLFDKQLRLMTLDALERIEIALRVDVCHLLGEQDPFAHLNESYLHPSFTRKKNAYQNWKRKYDKLLSDSREDFVRHYHQTHGADLPIWVACEAFDFGTLSKLFSMMKVTDQQAITVKYGLPASKWKVFQSWLRSLNYIRNVCAHHSRLWNRNMDVKPQLPELGELDWCDTFIGQPELISRVFTTLSIASHMVKVICPNTEWTQRLETHLLNFPELHSDKQLGLSDMGCPEGWQETW